MFKILKKSAFVSLIFAIVLSFVVCAASITTQVSFEGSLATITGKIDGTSSQSEVSLLVGEPGNIVYIDQKTTENNGNFSFIVPFNENMNHGQYNYKIGSNANTETYEDTINYEGPVNYITNNFLSVDINVSVSSYVPAISGTISCAKGKKVNISIKNITDNVIIAQETITSDNGEYELSYTLPNLISPKEYEALITVDDGSCEQVALNVNIDSAIIFVEAMGSISLTENTWLDVTAQSIGNDLINESTRIANSKELSLTIPNLVSNASVNLIVEGYERIVEGEEDSSRPNDSEENIQYPHDDLYGNSFETATEITDILYPVLGTVDQNSSDYISFIAPDTDIYVFDNISLENSTVSLYSSEQLLLASGTGFEYNLTGGNTYYLKFSSEVESQYILTVAHKENVSESFDIYQYDQTVSVYQVEIEKICENTYYDDAQKSKELYEEYNNILDVDMDLHRLPGFLGTHPKDVSDYDDLINRYYQKYANEFKWVQEEYINIIADYDEEYGYSEPGHISSPVGYEVPKILIDETSQEYISGFDSNTSTWARARTPDLTIDKLTAETIRFSVQFPYDKIYGNGIFLISFGSGGITRTKNIYRVRDDNGMYQYNRSDTIHDLTPGQEYILYMTWPSEDNSYYGGDCSIYRRVKLPYDYPEEKTQYDGEYVSARFEDNDVDNVSTETFNKWLDRINLAYEKLMDLTGYTPYGGRNILLDSTRDNLSDIYNCVDGENWWEIISGYSGNPILCGQATVAALMKRLDDNDWGDTIIHELSHDFDKNIWDFDSHALCYLKMHYIMDVLDARFYRNDVINEEFDNSLTAKNESGEWYSGSYYRFLQYDHKESYSIYFDENEEYSSAGFACVLIDIQKKIGWEPFAKTFRYFSSLNESQIPDDNGYKLNLFLSKLKEYSGYDVMSVISKDEQRIIERHFGTNLTYVETPYPIINETDKAFEIKEGYSVFQFEPKETGNYNIFTSPFYNSTLSNDTYMEVFSDREMTELIVSNDDYDGTRFSKVTLNATAGGAYYIKVRHYSGGYLQSMINVVKDEPIGKLHLDEAMDLISNKGEYKTLSFTPNKSGTYTFDVTNYFDEDIYYDTYIKLYSNDINSQLLGKDNNKFSVDLQKNHTYYLYFSGLFKSYAFGTVSVMPGDLETSSRVRATLTENEKIMSLTGYTTAGAYKSVTLTIQGPNGDVVYYDKITSSARGRFEFIFSLGDYALKGLYTAKLEGANITQPYIVAFDYEGFENEVPDIPESNVEIYAECTIEGNIVYLNGSISTGDGKEIAVYVQNSNEQLVYINQLTSKNDGNFDAVIPLTYNIMDGMYQIKLGAHGLSKPYVLTFQYILSQTSNYQMKSSVSYGVDHIIVSGMITPVISTDMRIEIVNESSEVVAQAVFESDLSGAYMYNVDFTDAIQSGEYTVNIYADSIGISNSQKIYVVVPIEKTDIIKSENENLYIALKKARPVLDEDNNGTITIAELEAITGTLDISSSSIESIDGLQACTNVIELYINDNKISELDYLSGLSNLSVLIADNNNISDVDLLPASLTYLNVSRNNLTDIEGVQYTNNLEYLFADENNISNIDCLENKNKLKSLSLSINTISDIAVLSGCTELTYLNLSHNGITDVSSLNVLKKLRDLRLSNNTISNITLIPNVKYRNLYLENNSISLSSISVFEAVNIVYLPQKSN